ncbi:41233_t:CDS:1 [Gigaspora margarita]|uniref:41233_t:CDS:1 n=1 Tax=Gigaspora margarita TaxID=4874 RepID=A0ABN7UNE9_GIGMA|nr:41233_t:CDS:1 [Gigaspora margarita]
MAAEPGLLTAIHRFQNPIPQFALGSLPAMATIGTTPHDSLLEKFLWFMRCLGCPFTGLFYFCNIKNDPIAMGTYWLSSEYFKVEYETENEDTIDIGVEIMNERIIRVREENKNTLNIRPVGHHAMKIKPNKMQKRIINDWIAEASLLDRLSSLVSAYYILVGIFAGIFKAAGPCMSDSSLQDWPYIPLLLIWTLPAIYVRIRNGKVVNKVLLERLKNEKIIVKNYNQGKIKSKKAHVAITALASVALPWLAVIIAYFTRPIGFFCRSKYLTVICTTWSFNSVIAYICHIIGEKDEYGHVLTHVWFCVCGVFITGALILLSLLANTKSWWIDIFGDICNVPLICA